MEGIEEGMGIVIVMGGRLPLLSSLFRYFRVLVDPFKNKKRNLGRGNQAVIIPFVSFWYGGSWGSERGGSEGSLGAFLGWWLEIIFWGLVT